MSDMEDADQGMPLEDWIEEQETRQCSNTCSHFDEINQCCWIATERRLCTDVHEGDYCLYGFKEGE